MNAVVGQESVYLGRFALKDTLAPRSPSCWQERARGETPVSSQASERAAVVV